MKTKQLKLLVIVLLFSLGNLFVSCSTDDEGNFIGAPEDDTELIDTVWTWSSDQVSGSLQFNNDGTYVYGFNDGTADFTGAWSWVNEEDRIMKVNEIVDFDGSVISTYNKFEYENDGSVSMYRIQIVGDEVPDKDSDWEYDLYLVNE